jgi:hypothetical protein
MKQNEATSSNKKQQEATRRKVTQNKARWSNKRKRENKLYEIQFTDMIFLENEDMCWRSSSEIQAGYKRDISGI